MRAPEFQAVLEYVTDPTTFRWSSRGLAMQPYSSRHCHVRAEIDVLDSMKQAHPFLHGTREGFAPGD